MRGLSESCPTPGLVDSFPCAPTLPISKTLQTLIFSLPLFLSPPLSHVPRIPWPETSSSRPQQSSKDALPRRELASSGRMRPRLLALLSAHSLPLAQQSSRARFASKIGDSGGAGGGGDSSILACPAEITGGLHEGCVNANRQLPLPCQPTFASSARDGDGDGDGEGVGGASALGSCSIDNDLH